MKRLLIFFSCVCMLSCKTGQPFILPPAEIRETVVERLVPYQIPADSAHFYALLECDSLNNVILKEYSEYKSTRMESDFSLNQNLLSWLVLNPETTGHVKATDSVRTERIPYPVEVPVPVNVLTEFQTFQIKVAYVAEGILLCLILVGIFNWKKLLKKLLNK